MWSRRLCPLSLAYTHRAEAGDTSLHSGMAEHSLLQKTTEDRVLKKSTVDFTRSSKGLTVPLDASLEKVIMVVVVVTTSTC